MTGNEAAPNDLVLSLETSGDVCSVAVARGRQLVVEHTFQHRLHLSERLMGQIDAVLREADAALADAGLFAVGIGPGSFTGTRIGVMTAKTLALVEQKPIVGIGALEAMAAEYAGVAETVVVPMAPCRIGIVYTCPFRTVEDVPEPLAEVGALSIPELAALLTCLESPRILCCGPSAERYIEELKSALSDTPLEITQGAVTSPRASMVGRLAALRLETGLPPDDPITLVPLYISPPPITQPKAR